MFRPVTLTDLEESELAKQREECANQKTRLIPLELINEPDSVMGQSYNFTAYFVSIEFSTISDIYQVAFPHIFVVH